LGVCFFAGAALVLIFAGSVGGSVAYPWFGLAVILCGVGVFGIRTYNTTAKLLQSGTRATATVIGVKNTGMLINNVPRFLIEVRVDRPGAPFEAQIGALTYSPAAIGSVVDVCYDPNNVKHITFAPEADASSQSATSVDPSVTAASLGPDTTVALLAQLEKMLASGALSDDEFARAKRRVLGNS
jgi:hypothetical protein